jgi:hypothetical protein
MNSGYLKRKAHLRHANDDSQRFASHDKRNIDDVSDRRIAAVELEQNVRGVCGDDAENNNGEDSRNHANRVHHSWKTENSDADLVGEEDEGSLQCSSDQALTGSCLHVVVLTLVIPSFLPP